MREFDESGLALADMQGNLFEQSAIECDCSSAVFIRRFMNSSLARRMDSASFLNEACSIESMIQEIEDQYGKSQYGRVKYSGEELYWMGYIYRYWCYVFEENSKAVCKVISARELRMLYESYHALDPKTAIERVLEAKGVNVGQAFNSDEERIAAITKQGVEALRRIRKERIGEAYYEYHFTSI